MAKSKLAKNPKPDKSKLPDYAEVLARLGKRTYLLLGNGFSISCDQIFSYSNLFEIAKKNSLNQRSQQIFDKLGTNNFEGVLHHLDHFKWMTEIYGLSNAKTVRTINGDLSNLKQALIRSIAQTHPGHSGKLSDEKKQSCANFLKPYHVTFTTNYDLLLYWVELFALDELQGRDGFGASEDDPDAPYCVLSEALGRHRGICFIHGALHLFMAEGEIRKHSWNKSQIPLIQSVQDGLAREEYPLFVAEGDSEKKMEQINRNRYLSYCYSKLSRIESDLVVYGLSFGPSDAHIADAIAHSKSSRIYVSLHGDPDSDANKAIRGNVKRIINKRHALRTGRQKKYQGWPGLESEYFQAETANVWSIHSTRRGN